MRSLFLRGLCRFPLVAARRIHVGRGQLAGSMAAAPCIRPVAVQLPFRWYSAGLASPTETEERVLKVLRNFDKVDATKLSATAPFTQLGLDSLDVVEVMIALEEEFHIEIPDPVADKVQTPKEIAEYIYGFMNPAKATKEEPISEDNSHH